MREHARKFTSWLLVSAAGAFIATSATANADVLFIAFVEPVDALETQ